MTHDCCSTCLMAEEIGDALLCLETLTPTTYDDVCELWLPILTTQCCDTCQRHDTCAFVAAIALPDLDDIEHDCCDRWEPRHV